MEQHWNDLNCDLHKSIPSGSALAFIDNHDNQRGHGGGGSMLTFREPRLYKVTPPSTRKFDT